MTGADFDTQPDESYSYDENGNRTHGSYATDPNNQLASDGTYVYTYDAEGNRLTRTNISTGYVTEYVWDHRNRLEAEIEKDDMDNILAVVEHSYDYQNRWVRRSFDDDGPGSNDPVDTLWVYDGWQQALEFVNANTSSDAGPGDLAHVYFWATPLTDYLLADEIKDGSQTSDDVRWSFADHLGTPRLVVAHLGGWDYAFNERTYDTFGNLLAESDPTYGTAIGFTGKMFDITTGFGYHINRWYDAAVGRWTAEDPIVFGGGDTNLARWVHNAVTQFVDSDGLREHNPGWGGWNPANWGVPSPSDYFHYLTNPWEMDRDLEVGFYAAAGTAAVAGTAAGGLAVAGYGGLTVTGAVTAATPVVATEVLDTAVEEGLSAATGLPIMLPMSPADIVQDGGKLLLKRAAKTGLENAAEKGVKNCGDNLVDVPEGIVYKRTNPESGEGYVGQAKSPERFEARQGEHDYLLDTEHEYEILGRAEPGNDLDVLEETMIREHGGLQREGGPLANRRHQMREERYRRHGGRTDDPNRSS